MLRQVVAPHEALLADGAAELLLARVRAIVPCQLVRARELLVALLPAAGERPLTCRYRTEVKFRPRPTVSPGHWLSPSSKAYLPSHSVPRPPLRWKQTTGLMKKEHGLLFLL